MIDLKTMALVVFTGVLSPCAEAVDRWPQSPIDWQVDCPPLPGRAPNPHVLARTQCATVTVPRDHQAPERGTLHLTLTRVGALQPHNRLGVVVAQHSRVPRGVLAVHLASLWQYHDTPADRTLANRYDLIELSPRNLDDAAQLEQSARDLELVRTQLADEQFNYLGSADTARLGVRYAQLYPGRVNRMVLLDSDAPAGPWLRLKGAYWQEIGRAHV